MAKLASGLGHANPTTVQGWKDSGFIPPKHHQAIFDLAVSEGIEIAPTDFLTIQAASNPPKEGEAAA